MKKYIWLTLLLLGVGGIILSMLYMSPDERENKALLQSNTIVPMDTSFILSSKSFSSEKHIPEKYTCDGENSNPPLSITGVPDETQSLVLIMEDPDIPESVKKTKNIDVFDHWVVFNIPPHTEKIRAGQEPEGVPGANSTGTTGYTGPCPPDGTHRYVFTLYALDTMLDLEPGSTKGDVQEALGSHVIGETELVGLYKRN